MTTRLGKWDRRFARLGIVDLEARAEHEAAELARIEEERDPHCPICGDSRDPRTPYCSAACCADDEGTDLSPVGFAGDHGIRPVAFDMPGFVGTLLRNLYAPSLLGAAVGAASGHPAPGTSQGAAERDRVGRLDSSQGCSRSEGAPDASGMGPEATSQE